MRGPYALLTILASASPDILAPWPAAAYLVGEKVTPEGGLSVAGAV